MTVACVSCEGPIVWAVTVPGNKRAPFDPDPVLPGTHGAMHLVPSPSDPDVFHAYSTTELETRIAAKLALPLERAMERAAEYPLHASHFATCPQASTHRRRK